MLASSSSAQSLKVASIESTGTERILNTMHCRALILILQQLPQIKLLTLHDVQVSSMNFTCHEIVALDTGPVLNHLKEVNVDHCNEDIFKCFWNAKNVKNIKMSKSYSSSGRCLGKFLNGQDNLESLTMSTDVCHIESIKFGLPKLKKLSLECRFELFCSRCSLIENSPSLECLSLEYRPGNFDFLRALKSLSLNTLILDLTRDSFHQYDFEMARAILMNSKAENLPSLKVLRSKSGSTILEF